MELLLKVENIFKLFSTFVCMVYLIFIFYKPKTKWNIISRLIMSVIIFFSTIAQILIKIQMNETYELLLVNAITWYIVFEIMRYYFVNLTTKKS